MLVRFKSNSLQWPAFASLKQCTQIHAQIIITGTVMDCSIFTNLLRSLTDPENGDLAYAITLFRQIPKPATFLWNTIIRACSRNQTAKESIRFYHQMRRASILPDVYTFQFLFKACAQCSSIWGGQAIHGNFIKLFVEYEDVAVENSLIHMYSEFSWIDVARKVFDRMVLKNVVSWTSIVGGYVKIGFVDEARRLFDEMPERNVVSWTTMIAGYAQNNRAEDAVKFFMSMVRDGIKPDVVAMVSVLSACAQLRDLDLGKWLHQFINRERIIVRNNLAVALIDMYAKCGDIGLAHQVFDSIDWKALPTWNALIDGYCKLGDFPAARSLFDRMVNRDIISYNSLICGYMQNCSIKEALLLFAKLRASGLKPDKFTMVGLLTGCANVGSLDLGKLLHAYIEENPIEPDVFLGTALLDMYAKCGRIDQALLVFNRMHEKDVLTWTAMILSLAMHGNGKIALAHFSLMRKEGNRPNRITYIGVLTACSHSGLVEEGHLHFNEMKSVYNIEPEIEHYGCMVDLLGRAGYLKEAERLIQGMPVEPNAIIWASLLGACRVYNDVNLAEKAAKHLLILEPHKAAVYVSLYNVYARSGKWASAGKIRGMMEDRGIRKISGCSSITVNGTVHNFFAGDREHPQFEEIQEMMVEMAKHLKLAGYVPGSNQVCWI